MLSPFQPTQQFGLLMALATCFAMLSNQMVLPRLLASYDPATTMLNKTTRVRFAARSAGRSKERKSITEQGSVELPER
jgi:hypothetical protein